jgi:hypothetical protein
MMYLYGLLSRASAAACDPILGIAGVTGPVQVLATEHGVLVFGHAETAELAPKRRNLMAHARVLEACQELGDLLPMRFGMTARDREEIERTLGSNRLEIEAQFNRIRGKVEFGLKVGFSRDAALHATLEADPALAAEHRKLGAMVRPPHFAAADFGRRLAEALDRRRTNAQRAILSALSDLCDDHVLAAPENDVQILNLHVLAQRDTGDVLARAAQAAATASQFVPCGEATVKLIGPEPPFNFVSIALETAARDAA